MKGIIVLSFDWENPEQIPESLMALNPGQAPHLYGDARITMDGVEGVDVATNVLNYLDHEHYDRLPPKTCVFGPVETGGAFIGSRYCFTHHGWRCNG